MSKHYPLKFTLDDGIHVEVDKTGNDTYEFILKPKEGPDRHFTFIDDASRENVTESLDFDQLNAVRRFWLEQEDVL